MDLTQKTSLVATCNQELINLRSAAKSAVTDCQSELGECRQQAEAALLEQKRTAKEEIEALEQRYLAAFKQHQDLFNQEAAKNQKCQEQITIVNRQSTELTVQYKSAIDSCISECNGALQNQLQTSQNTYTKEKQEMTAQYIQIKTQLETQLSDCVSGLSEHNATAKQQLLAFQQQVKEARLQVTNMEERVSQCMTEGNRLFQEYEAYKGDCSRKEAAAMDMKNQCQSAVNQLQQSKQDAENQLAQCTEQLRGAMQMMEQPQNAGPRSNELPFCNICVQYCTSGDVRLKVYKGGWFLPGHQSLPFSSPDKRAPAGGCVCCLAPGYLPVKERAYLQISAKSDAA
jgi:chromosome segregation ATPase